MVSSRYELFITIIIKICKMHTKLRCLLCPSIQNINLFLNINQIGFGWAVDDKIFSEKANCETTYFVRPESEFCHVEPDKTLATFND